MFKNLMNGASLLAIARFDKEADERAALRAKIAGNTKVEAVSDNEKEAKENEQDTDDKSDNDDGDESGEAGEEENDDEENEEKSEEEVNENKETEEEKAEREKQEKIAAKAKRKQDRMQARIDEATAAKKAAEAEVARLKAQLEADPDKKLTPEEVEARAQALADKKLQEQTIKKLQEDFDETCEVLRKEAKKIDKDFDDKVNEMAETFGAIPSFMIGVLGDLKNGGEVLAYLANDEDEAERIYDLAKKPAKMTNELVLISLKLEEAKKPKKKEISKVKAITPVKNNGGSSQTTVITEADTKNMDSYVAKRIAQREAQRKARGY